jgi:hypothetical protein
MSLRPHAALRWKKPLSAGELFTKRENHSCSVDGKGWKKWGCWTGTIKDWDIFVSRKPKLRRLFNRRKRNFLSWHYGHKLKITITKVEKGNDQGSSSYLDQSLHLSSYLLLSSPELHASSTALHTYVPNDIWEIRSYSQFAQLLN